ncbi:AbfB domain-containing protein [Nocardiopsis kunsanensis]|uniref:AbfB domain-containing protein n=1 Tax=Nocardiopsis kunsanensis TaxID=141693 RepID=UPI00034A69D3|nr:AbfB domain-containing protein [Nocardiopsis kunsanensis]
MITPWTHEVGPGNAPPEYPRPQMVREDWLNLNGTWRFVPGPSDDRCCAPESVERPGHYLRHHESRVSEAENDGSDLFAEDATWCGVPGQGGYGVSLRSYTCPDKFLRHYGSELRLAGMDGTNVPHDTARAVRRM